MKDKPAKVLIAIVHPELDPTRDVQRFSMGFGQLLSGEEQWKQEGPILKVSRRLFTSDDLNSARVFLLYTRLSAEGQKRRAERVASGIPGPRVSFEHAEQRARFTQSYLKFFLKIPEAQIVPVPLDFDDENVSDLNQWLATVPQNLNWIIGQLGSNWIKDYDLNIIYSGASQARDVIMGCLIGGLIPTPPAKLWSAPDPERVPQSQERVFKYEINVLSLIVSPPKREKEIAENFLLALFKYTDTINVYLGGVPLNLGNRRENKKAQLLYELALARKGMKYATSPSGGVKIDAIQLHGDKPHLRLNANKAVAAHTNNLVKNGKLSQPITELITIANRGEWCLNIKPEEIHVD